MQMAHNPQRLAGFGSCLIEVWVCVCLHKSDGDSDLPIKKMQEGETSYGK